MEAINLLKTRLEQKIGIDQISASDLKILQKHIFSSTSKEVSFNTLRRFFGLLPATKTQIRTLDILAQYLGFGNFYTFSNQYQFPNWELWLEIVRMKYRNLITDTDIAYLNKNLSKEPFTLHFIDLINHFILTDNEKALYTLFDVQIEKLDRPEQLKISVASGLAIRNIFERKLDFRFSMLLKNPNFRRSVLYNFIDYKAFNSGYIDLIKASSKFEKDPNHLFFLKILMSYALFLNNDKQKNTKLDIEYSKLQNVYPIVQGRYFSYRFYNAKNNEEQNLCFNKMLSASQKENKCEFFFEVIPVLMILKKIDLIEEIYELYYEEIFEINEYNRLTHLGLFQIGLSLVSIKNGNIKQAKNELNKVSYELAFDSYIDYTRLFYLISEYHINKKSETKTEYLSISKNLQFKIFSEHLLESYFLSNT